MAFLSLAAISAAAGAANFLLTEDPRRLPALAEEERRLLPLASSSGSSSKAAAAARFAGAVAGEPAGVLTLEAELEMESAPLRHRTSSRTAAAAVTGSGSSSSLLPLPATPSPAPPRHMAQEDSAHDSTLQLPAPSAKQQLSGLAGEVAAVLRIPTFRLIVAQVTLVWQLWVPCCRRSFCQLLWSAHAACEVRLQLQGGSDPLCSLLP